MTQPLLITLLIFLCSGPAYAEWVVVSINDEAGLTVYADPDTIRRKGNLVKMWELVDFRTVQTIGPEVFLSYKTQREFDCTEARYRMLASTDFAGNMGSGKVGSSSVNNYEWEAVQPDSVGQTLWKAACGKK